MLLLIYNSTLQACGLKEQMKNNRGENCKLTYAYLINHQSDEFSKLVS